MTEYFPVFSFHKALMMEYEWENLKCKECGGELELEKTNEFEEVKNCKDCGYRVLFIKKLRDDFE